MSKKKTKADRSGSEQLRSPLTKELLEEIKKNFEIEIKNIGGLSEKMWTKIIDTHNTVIEETVDAFIRNLLTTVIDEWVNEDRRRNNGRRRTDGII